MVALHGEAWQATGGHVVMIACTIATPNYSDLANREAEWFRKNSGLDTIVMHINREEDGYAKKLELPSLFPGQTVVFWDADYRLCRPTDFREFAVRREFFGVFDGGVHCPEVFLHKDTGVLGMQGDLYINTGFWIANFARQDHINAFAIARQLMAEKSNGLHQGVRDRTEQSMLNAGLQRAGVEIQHLHPRYNFYLYGFDRGFTPSIPSRIIGLHAAGVVGAERKMAALDAQYTCLCDAEGSHYNREPIEHAATAFNAWSKRETDAKL